MFSDLEGLNILSLGAEQIIGNLLVAFLCGIVISYFYRWSHRGPAYQVSFVRSLIVLAMITAIVMMVIGNNLARAFGLVGAMSIIRFRTALKDAQDIVFVFFALAIGLAAGVGYRQLAVVSTLFVGATMLLLTRTNFGSVSRHELVLQFSYTLPEEDVEAPYVAVLERHCKGYDMLNMRSRGGGEWIDLTFAVNMKRKADGIELTRALGRIDGVRSVSIFSDEDPDV